MGINCLKNKIIGRFNIISTIIPITSINENTINSVLEIVSFLAKKKTENALNYLKKALHNIDKSVCPKNRLSCKNNFGTCEFYNTKHCT